MPLPKFDAIDAALNFHRDSLEIEGSCDIYTIKQTKSDKILKTRIDSQIAHEHQSNLRIAASLSPPDAERFAISTNLGQESPFGSLSQVSNRRTYAYLIGALNASHPDYDLSNILRPNDFCKERNLQDVINDVDEKVLGQKQHYWQTGLLSARSQSRWGYDKWKMLDDEMELGECEVYNFLPAENPFDGDGTPLWSCHYLFFNKSKKRVCYLHVRAIDPAYEYDSTEEDIYDMDEEEVEAEDEDDDTLDDLESQASKRKHQRSSTDLGAEKRAKYWLGNYAKSVVRGSGSGSGGGAGGSFSEDDRADVDQDLLAEIVQHRKAHPEIYNTVVIEDDSDARSSVSPTPGSSEDDEGDVGVGVGKKTHRSRLGLRGDDSDARAMSADLAKSVEP